MHQTEVVDTRTCDVIVVDTYLKGITSCRD